LKDATAVHDFNKFWEMMRRDRGSTRPPLTRQQLAAKPPVSHPVFLTHPIRARKVLYADPATRCGSTIWMQWKVRRSCPPVRLPTATEYCYEHQWSGSDLICGRISVRCTMPSRTTGHTAAADAALPVMADWNLPASGRGPLRNPDHRNLCMSDRQSLGSLGPRARELTTLAHLTVSSTMNIPRSASEPRNAWCPDRRAAPVFWRL